MEGPPRSSEQDQLTTETKFDPNYEVTRISDEAQFLRKLKLKRFLYRWVGEIYIGKRAKLAHFRRLLDAIKITDGGKVLEVGSGDGLFSFEAATMLKHCRVIGMELNACEALACEKIARTEGLENLQFQQGILSDFNWTNEFELVFCLDVLEHIKEDLKAAVQIHDALKSNGTVLIHVPSRHYQDVDGSMHTVEDELAWKINPGHVRNGYTEEELTNLLSSAGFKSIEVIPTQRRPIAKAHNYYRMVEKIPPLRIAVLPLMDFLIRQDLTLNSGHGNTLWAKGVKS